MVPEDDRTARARKAAELSRLAKRRHGPVIDLPETGRPSVRRLRIGRLLLVACVLVAAAVWSSTESGRARLHTLVQAVVGSFHEAFDDPPQHQPKQRPGKPASAPAVRPASAPPLRPHQAREAPEVAFVALQLASKGPAAEKTWPRNVALEGTPEVTTVSQGSDVARFVYRSPAYEFIADSPVGADVVRECARVFEATYLLNCRLPLDLRPAPEAGHERFIARLFSSSGSYLAAGGMPGSSGTYDRQQACILVPVASLGIKMVNGRMQTDRTEATETLVHEITHQMMSAWLPRLPRWYAEGSADYVAMADYVHGRFFLSQMEDRLRLYLRRRGQQGKAFQMLRPGELMALDGTTWSQAVASNAAGAAQNYASATLLTYYFYHLDGNGDSAAMLGYLHALEAGTPEHEAAQAHLLHGRTVAQLETDLVNAFQHHGVNLNPVSRSGKVWQ